MSQSFPSGTPASIPSHRSAVGLSEFEDLTPPVIRELSPTGYNPSWLEVNGRTIFSIRKNRQSTRLLELTGNVFSKPKVDVEPTKSFLVQNAITSSGPVALKDLNELPWVLFLGFSVSSGR